MKKIFQKFKINILKMGATPDTDELGQYYGTQLAGVLLFILLIIYMIYRSIVG